MSPLPVPPASAGRETLADWAELTALGSVDRNISFEDIAEEIRRGGTAEALVDDPATAAEEVDQRAERIEALVDAVFTEFDERSKAGAEGYPYRVEDQVLQGPRRRVGSTYVFLLLLACFGKDAGPTGNHAPRADRLFEELCAVAFSAYLGPAHSVEMLPFGHPRRPGMISKAFRDAVTDYCERLGEGGGISRNPGAARKNDARLDLIAWLPFPDERAGKVLGYGQCSTSQDWEGHLTLRPAAFNKLWIREPLQSDCLLFSFFPHRIKSASWAEAVALGGIPFDRCRVARYARRLQPGLRQRCAEWVDYVFERRAR